LSLDLNFPPDATIRDISGDDLANWKATPGSDRLPIAHIGWHTRGILRRQIQVAYDLPQPLTAPAWKLESPVAQGGAISPPLYVMALPPGLELTTPAGSVQPRQLPGWMAHLTDGINYMEYAGDKPLQAHWLPLVEIPRAVVDAVQAKMRIVPDGAELTEVIYTIRHEAGFTWDLTLPEGAELLGSSINGKPVAPNARGNHVAEFSLPSGRQSDEIQLSYLVKCPPFNPVSGKVTFDLPETQLLTSKLSWELQIPDGYEVAAIDGNVQADGGSDRANADSHVLHLHREIFKGERPGLELFYEKPLRGQQ
jgi:hypothetical protein